MIRNQTYYPRDTLLVSNSHKPRATSVWDFQYKKPMYFTQVYIKVFLTKL